MSDYFYDQLEPTPEPYPEEVVADAKAGQIIYKNGKPVGVRLYDAAGTLLTNGLFLENGDTVTFELDLTLGE